MFGPRHYVPVLRAKPAELRALKSINLRYGRELHRCWSARRECCASVTHARR
jgi:hypothetical protein